MKKVCGGARFGKYKQKVDDELAEGNKIGANGTPAFFINGRSLSGAQPIEQFKSVIETARSKNVDAMLKGNKMPAGGSRRDREERGRKGGGSPAGGGEEEDKTVYKVDPGEGPSFGPKNAPVTIVEFSDFQCPFCRARCRRSRRSETYGNKVRVVWRNYPLPFHQDAKPAAEACDGSRRPGKFWEMHDKLFENQRALDRASLEKYAAEIGIDVSRFWRTSTRVATRRRWMATSTTATACPVAAWVRRPSLSTVARLPVRIRSRSSTR